MEKLVRNFLNIKKKKSGNFKKNLKKMFKKNWKTYREILNVFSEISQKIGVFLKNFQVCNNIFRKFWIILKKL